MKFSRQRRPHRVATISMIPLIDLFMNVLVFFLVTTTFGADSVFFVDLPEASQQMGLSEAKQVLIAIGPTGEIAVNDHLVKLSGLEDELAQIPADRRGQLPIVIRADRNALHGAVVGVIDVVRTVGFENVGMATKVMRK